MKSILNLKQTKSKQSSRKYELANNYSTIDRSSDVSIGGPDHTEYYDYRSADQMALIGEVIEAQQKDVPPNEYAALQAKNKKLRKQLKDIKAQNRVHKDNSNHE